MGMTREEAIAYGKRVIDLGLNDETQAFCQMAIKALEQEPTSEMVHVETLRQVMWERDIAIEQLKELGYGFGQKIEPCGDVISLEVVIEWLKDKDIIKLSSQEEMARKELKALSSVNPQEPSEIVHGSTYGGVSWGGTYNPQEPKTGHWIRMKTYEKWGCSECSTVFRFTFKEHDYCPNCGARMESEEV